MASVQNPFEYWILKNLGKFICIFLVLLFLLGGVFISGPAENVQINEDQLIDALIEMSHTKGNVFMN